MDKKRTWSRQFYRVNWSIQIEGWGWNFWATTQFRRRHLISFSLNEARNSNVDRQPFDRSRYVTSQLHPSTKASNMSSGACVFVLCLWWFLWDVVFTLVRLSGLMDLYMSKFKTEYCSLQFVIEIYCYQYLYISITKMSQNLKNI